MNVVSYLAISNISEAGFRATFRDVVGNWVYRGSETRSCLTPRPLFQYFCSERSEQMADKHMFSTLEVELFRHISAGQDDHPPPNAALHSCPRLLPLPVDLLTCDGTAELPRASQACRFAL